ncbi:MAG: NAD(P)-dependent glycerol-1-phosphate dehydrogenase [Candidatus Heimdallarchaeota archaeon]|nr:NAD(P)-dependent glycerol-1-phosphate dehydrogenase [Candidatus Heimdallarchaeota archaeon]MDH5647044.1 NAD(P)-dependent glycerol-1-phosphate dehydrogenase [Candidatus Heimdallarchaeota archaeon]
MRLDRPAIELPRLIEVRSSVIEEINLSLKRLNLKGSCILVADEITIKILGEKIMEVVKEEFDVEALLISEATIEEAKRFHQIYSEKNTNFVLAVGGGRVIDVAKYSSYLSNIPFISIPTVASHDGISSPRASLLGIDKKHSLLAHSPFGVIADIDVISNAPKRFTISGCADIICNKTAVLDWELSNRITGEHISHYSVALSNMTAETMIKSADIIATNTKEAAYTVMKGLITSSMSMCIAGSSRPASGAEHMISHVLEDVLEKPALHGEQCGIASIVTMYLHGGDWLRIRKALQTIGAPITLKEIGIDEDVFVDAIVNANSVRPDRFTILSSGITKKAAIAALSETGLLN